MSPQPDRQDEQISADLLEQLQQQSEVLGVFDEGQDIALDLHEELFSTNTRQRALTFLQSPRYEKALETYQRLSTGPVDIQPGGAA